MIWQLSSPTDVAVNHEAITFVSDSVATTRLTAHALFTFHFLCSRVFPHPDPITYHTPAHKPTNRDFALIFPHIILHRETAESLDSTGDTRRLTHEKRERYLCS